ncbi:hypothetical protein [Hahella ganghwensis]|uniref:hypothetical protein n=1 Tax=Hahella ganghwensis TaxID=286420 RepID=UPI00037C2776|nr:hypothetical protein [Hahella ganghwensis]
MRAMIFNQASIYHLQQLELQYRRRCGQRFRLSDENARLELINKTSNSTDKIIQKYYRRFAHELEQDLVSELISQGIISPQNWH